ncbi:MAG: hypothetical protein OXE42_07785 [Gammaproteobacteria bacterium]|nr:hypothetical protein [Gammaproteobacteria bacterium]
MLLAEYAITPDVFDATSYVNEDLCAARLELIREVMLNEGVIRDLRNGSWSNLFRSDHRSWHRRAKELAKKLASQNRLRPFVPQLAVKPSVDSEWCDEALVTHGIEPLTGIIVTDTISDGYIGNPLVSRVDRLNSAPWWSGRKPSMRLNRTFTDYLNALSLVLRHANSIMFIDPHIDPTQPKYNDFIELIKRAGNRNPLPLIEIHRVCYRGSGQHRKILDLQQLEASFRNELTQPLQRVGLTAEIFVWDDFHDRYVLSNLVGIALLNSLDTTIMQNSTTTWTRLGHKDRDDVQREFDPASNQHKLKKKFAI